MKIVVVGVNGMLGHDLFLKCLASGINVVGYDLPDVNITTDINSDMISLKEGDILVNCAAYTDVDGAENNRELAFAVNSKGAENLAVLCSKVGARMVHISTDYVFDGLKSSAYTELDRTNPINVYGASKLEGEDKVALACKDFLIIRTQSLFGVNGNNFVKTMISLFKSRDEVCVVDDQISCPTYTKDLADSIIMLISIGYSGLINVSSEGSCSWYEFAIRIAELTKFDVNIKPVGTFDISRPAKRPANSILDKSLYKRITKCELSPWEEGLRLYLEELTMENVK